MSQTFVFGSYVAKASPVHALNAQVKILLTCAFSIAVFLIDGWPGLCALLCAVLALYAIARVDVTRAVKGLLPVAFILVFTIVVHTFSISIGTQAGSALNSSGSLGFTQSFTFFGTFGVTLGGFFSGLFFAMRIAVLVGVCALLTATTSMVELTDGMLKLLAPLRRLGVPIDDIAMMVSIALRFIPTTAQEAQAVQLAQKARCADFDEGSALKRVKAWVPVLVPLFVRLFRRADELAEAMDARCYGCGPRTHVTHSAVHARDIIVLACIVAALVVLCVVL